MKIFLLLFFLMLMHPSGLLAQEQQVVAPYTLADRDRAIRTEERLNGLESDMKELKNNVNRLEEKFNKYFMWEFGLVLVAIFGLVGFIIYDRRIVLAPLESKTNRIINVLKDAGDQNPTIKDSLKKNTIL